MPLDPYVVAGADGSIRVAYRLGEAGGSGLARARVVAVREDEPGSLRQDEILDAEDDGDKGVVVSSNLFGEPAGGAFHDLAADRLDPYRKYHVYLAAQDAQGWYSSPPGSAARIGSPGTVTGAPIRNNGGRTFDPNAPDVSLTEVRALADGKLRVAYTLAKAGNSKVTAAKLVASTADKTRDQVLAASGDGVADVLEAGIGDLVATIDGLAGWTAYKVYAAAKDEQGLYDSGEAGGSAAVSRAVDNNGGRTWDASAPEISIDDEPVFDGSVNKVKVVYTLADGGSSGIDKAVIYMREATSGQVHQSAVLDGDSGGVRKAATVGADQTLYFESDELKEYTDYRVYAAARDNQGNYNGSLAAQDATTHEPDPKSLLVDPSPKQLARSKTRDLTAPSVGLTTLAVPASGNDGRTAVVAWADAKDNAPSKGSSSGLKKVWLLATTASGAKTAADISGQATPGDTQRYASGTDASGSASIGSLRAGATVYGWIVAEDNEGNFSAPKRTDPESVSLDGDPPTVTFKSGSQSEAGKASVTLAVADSVAAGTSGKVHLRLKGNTTNLSSTEFTGTGDKTFDFTGLGSYGEYDVYVEAADGAGNELKQTVKTFRTWDTVVPSIGTSTTAGHDGTKLKVSYSLSDGGSGLRSLKAAFGTVNETMPLTGQSSVSGTWEVPGLSYGDNSVTLTLSDRASGSNTYLSDKASDNTASRTYTVTVADDVLPTFAGTVALSATGHDSLRAAWSAAFEDNESGLAGGAFYYSKTAPASGSKADVAAWRVAQGTGSVAVTAAALASAGAAEATGLEPSTLYYGYLCAKDVAGNTLDVATTPASAETDPPPVRVHGVYAPPTIVHGVTLNPNIIYQVKALSFAKDASSLYLVVSSNEFGQYTGPLILIKYNHATQTLVPVGKTAATVAANSLWTANPMEGKAVGVTIARGTPFVIEMYMGPEGSGEDGFVVHRHSGGAFSQVGKALAAGPVVRGTPGATLRYDATTDRLVVGYVAEQSLQIRFVSAPPSADGAADWTEIAVTGLPTTVDSMSFDFSPSGVMWLLAVYVQGFAVFKVTISGDTGAATAVREMGGGFSVIEKSAAFITVYDETTAAMTVGEYGDSIGIIKNGAFFRPAAVPLRINRGVGTVAYDAKGRLFAVVPSYSRVYAYDDAADLWSQVGPSFVNTYLNERTILAVSDATADIVVAGGKSSSQGGVTYGIIRPTVANPWPTPPQYYGDYGSVTTSDGPEIQPQVPGTVMSFSFAKDAYRLFLAISSNAHGDASGPLQLLQYDHDAGAVVPLAKTAKTNAAVLTDFKSIGVTLVRGVPHVVEAYRDTRDAAQYGFVAHAYSFATAAFVQFGTKFGADALNVSTRPGIPGVVIKYDAVANRVCVGYVVAATRTLKIMQLPPGASATTPWSVLAVSGVATNLDGFYFDISDSGEWWLVACRGISFEVYKVSDGVATVLRSMATLSGPVNTVFAGSVYIAAYGSTKIVVSVGNTGNSIMVNDSRGLYSTRVLPGEIQAGVGSVAFDANGGLFAVSPIDGKVFSYSVTANSWAQVGSTVASVGNRGVLVVSNVNADILVAGTKSNLAGVQYHLIRPASVTASP